MSMFGHGRIPVLTYTQDGASNSFTSTFDEVEDVTTEDINRIVGSNTSARPIALAVGAAAAEAVIALLPPGAFDLPAVISKGSRIAVRRGDGTDITSGILTANFLK